MKYNLFYRICLITLAAYALIPFAGCKKEKQPKKVVTMDDFFKQEIESKHCSVTLDEALQAYIYWIEHDESMKKFIEQKRDQAKLMTKCLRAVIEKKEDPKKVFQENHLHDIGMHEEDWLEILKEIKTVGQIDEMEKNIPDSPKKYLNDAGKQQFRETLEHWLLREYILCAYDLAHPDKKNMEKREKVELINSIGFRSMGFPLSRAAVYENVFMKVYPEFDFSEFFAGRLKKFPEYAAQERILWTH